jgi:hypothetical protein
MKKTNLSTEIEQVKKMSTEDNKKIDIEEMKCDINPFFHQPNF